MRRDGYGFGGILGIPRRRFHLLNGVCLGRQVAEYGFAILGGEGTLPFLVRPVAARFQLLEQNRLAAFVQQPEDAAIQRFFGDRIRFGEFQGGRVVLEPHRQWAAHAIFPCYGNGNILGLRVS